jgi:cell fate (sporulation/competence/biofilm development) regulator YmcA (YheA/YmcA/DUF963 family)
MADQDTVELLAKANSEISALSLVVSELLAEQCRTGIMRSLSQRKALAKLDSIAKKIRQFLADLPFTPDWRREQMKAWMVDRAENVISGARRSLTNP